MLTTYYSVDAGDDTSYVPGGVGEGEGQKGRKRHKSSSVRLLYVAEESSSSPPIP